MSPARLLAIVLLATAHAAAQRYGDLYGRVLDTSEGGISGASVTVVNQDTGFRRTTTTQTGGLYGVAALRPGPYKITVRKEGFRIVVRLDVPVEGPVTRADFALPVGSVEETITVYGNPPAIERPDASTATFLDRGDIERLPLNGRGLLTLFELTPGANVTPATRGEAGQFSATGQRANTNYFTVDAISANTGVAAGGLPAQSTGGALPALSSFGSFDSVISLDAIQDLRVTSSTSAAEFGRLPGANVAVNSRSGTNELHGAVTYRTRNELLSANDWFANQAGYGPLPLRIHDVAGSLGGPVIRNHTFFFLSYERMSLRQPYVWLQPVPTASIRDSAANWAQPVLQLFPQPSGGDPSGAVGTWIDRSVRPAGLQSGSVRIDQAIGSRVSFFGRYNDSPSDNEFGRLAVNQLDLRVQSLTLGLNARPTPSLVLDTRVNESQADADSRWQSGCALQPMATLFLNTPTPCDYLVRFSISGVAQLVSGREGVRRQRQFQFVQSGSWRRGPNTLMLGLDDRRITAVRRDFTGSLAVIADSANDLQDRTNLWIAKSDPQRASTVVNEVSLWAEDAWQPWRRLTLTAGLRWEYSAAPVATVNFWDPAKNDIVMGDTRALWPTSHRNFAPRLGMALRLSNDGSTVLRMGGGLYYDSSLSIATDALNGGPLSIQDFTSGRYGIFSGELSYGFWPNLRLPWVKQWNVALEHAFSANDTASIAYVGSAGSNLIRREVQNAGTTTTTWVALTSNHGDSDYHALQLQYRRRMSRHVEGLMSYAWSHSIDNDSSDAYLVWGGSGPIDRGSSDFDVRQSFSGALTYEAAPAGTRPLSRLFGGWALDGLLRARSGFPITVQESEEYIGIALTNAFRPDWVYGQPLWINDPAAPGGRRLNTGAFSPAAQPTQQGTLGRNVISGFGMWQVDLALRREFRWSERRRIQLRIEAFNVLNHTNFADPTPYLNSAVFGQSTSMLNLMLGSGSPGSGLAPILQAGGPRSLQGSLRFRF
jgi:hypothetical protein